MLGSRVAHFFFGLGRVFRGLHGLGKRDRLRLDFFLLGFWRERGRLGDRGRFDHPRPSCKLIGNPDRIGLTARPAARTGSQKNRLGLGQEIGGQHERECQSDVYGHRSEESRAILFPQQGNIPQRASRKIGHKDALPTLWYVCLVASTVKCFTGHG